MLGIAPHAGELRSVLRSRVEELGAVLTRLDEDALRRPSALPDWSRLTIACHLRYGAGALRRMTADALAGRPTAYYPEGRAQQRPLTLEPSQDGERPADVVSSLLVEARRLVDDWSHLDELQWSTPVVEPPDNPDLGTTALEVLLMAAVTEFEVHGTDLGLTDVSDWSPVFVARVLPARLQWLNVRRSNHRAFDRSPHRSWSLVAADIGLHHRIAVDGDTVSSAPSGEPADVTIEGTARDLLALLLGRPTRRPLETADERDLADFRRAFPGP